MSDFSADWLALREPYDGRARNPAVLDAVAAAFAGRAAITVVDLACGRGATLRAVAARLPAEQTWRLVDDDPDLLATATAIAAPPGVRVAALRLDLAQDLKRALEGSLELITASALLDLVSAAWVNELVTQAGRRRLPVYGALTYDGRTVLEPAEAGDAAIVAAVDRHQLGDKGFGPALGPTAAAFIVMRLKAAGYEVAEGPSDWVLGPADRAIQAEIFAGWAHAARETGFMAAAEIDRWLAARQAALAAGRSSLRVGHTDFFARPIATR